MNLGENKKQPVPEETLGSSVCNGKISRIKKNTHNIGISQRGDVIHSIIELLQFGCVCVLWVKQFPVILK